MTNSSWREARVVAVADLTPDTRSLEIVSDRGFVAPASGAHLKVAVTIGGRPDTRCYSVYEATDNGGYRIAVKRLALSRGGSAYMASLQPGARLVVAGPENAFPLTLARSDYLLVAGGIGVTPIFAHAKTLARQGAPFRLLYAARRREELALGSELAALLGPKLQTYVSNEDRRVDFTEAFAALAPEGEAYICGPLAMLQAAQRAWAQAGRPRENLRFETFGASGAWQNETFRVDIPRLNKSFEVPADKTLLQALQDEGVATISDCRRGECGLCALPILGVEGVVDHRDVFFSDEEKRSNAKLCACVSRIHGARVILDTADR